MELFVSDFLQLPELEGLRLAAGRQGVGRRIRAINVIDNPDSFDWLEEGELILNTGYLLGDDPASQRRLIQALWDIGCAGLCVKLGRYVSAIPRAMTEQADRLGLPLIELPYGYSLSTVSTALNRRLFAEKEDRLRRALSIQQEVMQVALTSDRLAGLTRTLSRIVDNPVLLTDSNWGLLSCFEPPDNPYPLSEHLTLTGGREWPIFPRQFMAALPADIGQYRKLLTRSFPVAPGVEIPCLIRPVADRSRLYGYLVVWASRHPLEYPEYLALEQVAALAALERLHAKEVEQSKLRAKKDFLADLLSGSIESRNAVESLAELHGLEFHRSYRCILIRSGTGRLEDEGTERPKDGEAWLPAAEAAAAAAAGRAGEELGFQTTCVSRGTQLAILLAQGRDHLRDLTGVREFAQRVQETLAAALPREPVYLVVGKAVSDLSRVDRSYKSAQAGFRLFQPGPAPAEPLVLDDYAAFQLLSDHVDRKALARFCYGSLEPLLGHARKDTAVLLQTLEKYFQYNGGITEAAKDMYVHRNTYLYRLEKIKTLLGCDLKDPQKLLELQLALLAYRVLDGALT